MIAASCVLVACSSGGPGTSSTGSGSSGSSGSASSSSSGSGSSGSSASGSTGSGSSGSSGAASSSGTGTQGSSGSSGAPGSHQVSGVAQKGPFEAGATVTLQELDALLNPTGQTFTVDTTDNSGSFAIPPAVTANLIEVIINGLFFDEVWANAQPTPATFHAYANLAADQATAATVDVNLMTHLQGERLQALLVDGGTYAAAEAQSRSEVLAAFNIPSQFGTDFTQVSLTDGTDESAILLAVSVVLLNAGYQGNSSTVEADAIELIDQLRLDMQGGAPSSTLQGQIAAVEASFTCAQMNAAIQRLTTYYASFGINFPAPPAMDFIDTGWTGTINRLRDGGTECCPVPDAGTDCGGACVDLQVDPKNCGSCGFACENGGTCEDGGCECPAADAGVETSCGGACVDLQSDPNNCGGCGFVCPTVCSGGACVEELATAQSYPTGIAVDATNVYWLDLNTGTVMKVGLDGGSPVTLATGQNSPTGIALDANNVYWSDWAGSGCDNGVCLTIQSVPIDGGSTFTLVAAQGNASIAIGQGYVYWSEPGTGQAGTGAIMATQLDAGSATCGVGGSVCVTSGECCSGSCTMDGCVAPAGPSPVLIPGQNQPVNLVTDSTSVYWTNAGTEANNFLDGTVMKALLDGGNVVTLASAQSNPSCLGVDSTSVYWVTLPNWTSVDAGAILKVGLDGGTPVVLASSPSLVGVHGLAVDGTNVYWTEYGTPGQTSDNGAVVSVPVGGGTATTLAADQNLPFGIAVDARSLYWTNNGTQANNLSDGTVVKLTPK